MSISFKQELIMLSDILDYGGFHKEAEEIDSIVKHNPVASGVERFAEKLKYELWNAKDIDKDVIGRVFEMIDELVSRGGFFVPSIKPDIDDSIKNMVLSLAEYENSVKQLEQELSGAGEEQHHDINAQLLADRSRLSELYLESENMLKRLREDGNNDEYQRFFDMYLSHTGRRYNPSV